MELTRKLWALRAKIFEQGPSDGGPVVLPVPDVAVMRATYRGLVPFRDWYFRVEVHGMRNVLSEPALYIANHNGGIFPLDGIFFGVAWHERFGFERTLYTMMHGVPFLLHSGLRNWLLAHGCLPASRANLEAAIRAGHSVLAFPGGDLETFRPYWERKNITLGERTGFVHQALSHRLPIVPVVCVGGHETMFVLSTGRSLARALRMQQLARAEVMPLYAAVPWGISLAFLPYLPLPAKIDIEVLAPLRLWEELPNADPSAPSTIAAGFRRVREAMQQASDRLYAARRFPVLG